MNSKLTHGLYTVTYNTKLPEDEKLFRLKLLVI